MTPHEALVAARALISEPEDWCEWVLALTERGEFVGVKHPDATRFCALGALMKVWPGPIPVEALALADKAANDLYGGLGIVMVNNKKGHSAVLAAFDLAIERAQKEAQS